MKKFLFSAILLFAGFLCSAQNQPPVAFNDTISGCYGSDIYVTASFLLQNDYDPDGDSIYVYNRPWGWDVVDDTTWKINLYKFAPYDTLKSFRYIIRGANGGYAQADVVVLVKASMKFTFLDVNDVRALISPFGNHFYDKDSIGLEVPKGTGKRAISSQAFWIGGKDDSSQLHVAADLYRETGTDFFTGPVSNIYNLPYFLKWNRVWKLDRQEIRNHILNWSSSGYQPINAITDWPAHGDVALGQAANIAPFCDANHNGIYDPMQGDYPIIRGDQAIFFIFNDKLLPHTETRGRQLGVEVFGMAYAFDRPEDSTLNNTIFFHYDMINRSDTAYHDTYVGWYNAFGLGSGSNYTGTDVTNGMAYSYSSDSADGDGSGITYGAHPPAIGMKIIGGPLLEPDGTDNPQGNCDAGINGLNFGDGIADNERIGLSYCVSGWDNSVNYYTIAYALLKGCFYGGSMTNYGGGYYYNAFNFDYLYGGGEGPGCRYHFPGNSDTLCNYGTDGVIPYGGYNQNGYYWTEEAVEDPPGWRRAVGSVGPFTLHAGESIPLDYCYTWARDYQGDNNSSVELLRERVSGLSPYWNDLVRLPENYTGINEPTRQDRLSAYPNPAHDRLNIRLDGIPKSKYALYSINGQVLKTGMLNRGLNSIDLSGLDPGIYLLKCNEKVIKVVKY